MQGNPEVIASLNSLLAGELASMDQYFIHSSMYEDWGLTKLYERIAHEFDDEKEHAGWLIQRILFLGGTPNMVKRSPLKIGANPQEMLANDLAVEIGIAEDLKKAMAVCEQAQDYQTREILRRMLEDTEIDHAYWLQKQLGLIERLGLQNYLQTMM